MDNATYYFLKTLVGVLATVVLMYAMYVMNDYQLSAKIIGAAIYLATALCPNPNDGPKP